MTTTLSLALQQAMATLDKKDRQEVLDNDWMIEEVENKLVEYTTSRVYSSFCFSVEQLPKLYIGSFAALK